MDSTWPAVPIDDSHLGSGSRGAAAKWKKRAARPAGKRWRATGGANRDAAYLDDFVYPERHLQERFYSMPEFLAAHGPGVIRHVHAGIAAAVLIGLYDLCVGRHGGYRVTGGMERVGV